MSKKRLEEIKGLLVKLHNAIDVDDETKRHIFNDLKLEWLIEQAERVRELERQNKALKLEVDGWFNKAQEIHESMVKQDKATDKLRHQNKRYREAIVQAIKLNLDDDFNYDIDKVLNEVLVSEE